ncbi:hypothetical protein K458DRAFT_404821 [Lentithecium fluviatile CBS 122367]|uniref:Uncharacterized protein n=1 Tax=Lentithecium fluviatile CBS 122367 TaxID=1168545 RepID=A0A6G1IZ39_9PLEO|nr:hypothetical protein K458DRAFT_404821 [Lentithecium fluviatile CBS 122367]
MRVEEKDSNRRVLELDGYGQFVDDVDKAICCYVPVEEGTVIKISGKFNGTTLAVAYDVVVDGVYRHAHSYNSKSVVNQKNKKLKPPKFLYQVKEEVLETDMKVAPAHKPDTTQGDGPGTLGTIELWIYVLRKFGEEHLMGVVPMYYDQNQDTDNDTKDLVTYNFRMAFETNCSAFDQVTANRARKKMDMKRPGKEPWAIFRFHYRNKGDRSPTTPRRSSREEPVSLSLSQSRSCSPSNSEATVGATDGEKPQEQLVVTGTTAVEVPETGDAITEHTALKVPLIKNPTGKPAEAGKITTASEASEETEKPAKPTAPLSDKAAESPAHALETTTPVTPAPMPPAKRPAAQVAFPGSFQTKRAKTAPIVPSARTATASSTVSSMPKPLTLAEKCKQLEAACENRGTYAKRRAQLAEKLAPYKKQMEEMEQQLNKQLEEENRAQDEKISQYKDEVAMLHEFKKAEGSN